MVVLTLLYMIGMTLLSLAFVVWRFWLYGGTAFLVCAWIVGIGELWLISKPQYGKALFLTSLLFVGMWCIDIILKKLFSKLDDITMRSNLFRELERRSHQMNDSKTASVIAFLVALSPYLVCLYYWIKD